jgi:RNA polymerase sigma-70 factor (ECF subfamily)
MTQPNPDTDVLLAQVGRGDANARSTLLDRHRNRLRQMVIVRLDGRLSARVDPSDVVQDVLMEADQKLDTFVRDRPLPFYPWLRQIAKERLIDLHRRHVRAKRRSVTREQPLALGLSDESVQQLFHRLVASGTSPSGQAIREDARNQVRRALELLSDRDREVLILRHLEKMPTAEIAAVLDISEGAVYTRHLRALQRLGKLLEKHDDGDGR